LPDYVKNNLNSDTYYHSKLACDLHHPNIIPVEFFETHLFQTNGFIFKNTTYYKILQNESKNVSVGTFI